MLVTGKIGPQIKSSARVIFMNRLLILLTSTLSLYGQTLHGQAFPQNPALVLQRADQIGDLYNWPEAKPVYWRAEQLYRSEGNREQALYAHVGWLRATMETRDLSSLSAELRRILFLPFVRGNKARQMRIWIAKGDVDAEMDSALAQSDWEQVAALAKEIGDTNWANRADGEIGFHRYVQGDHTAAKTRVGHALFAAHQNHDAAAEIRFLAGIGTGFELGGAHDEALIYLNRATALAKQHPETGYPYMAVAGTIMSLIGRGSLDSAAPLITQQLAQARRDHRMVKWTQARLFLADVSIDTGNRKEAIRVLNETIEIASKNGTRLLADVYSKLTNLYRQQGDLRNAERASAKAVLMAARGKDMYLAPDLLCTQATLQIDLHRENNALDLLQRANDIVEGMLAHTKSMGLRQNLLTTMGKVYAAQFELFARRNDVDQAYKVIEKVRGRIVTELIVSRPQIADLDVLDPQVEAQLTAIKLDLVKASSPKDRRRLLDQAFFLETKQWSHNMSGYESTAPRSFDVRIDQLRRVLRTDEALIEYVLDDPHSYCLLIDKRRASIYSLKGKKEIEAAADELLSKLRQKQISQTEGRKLADLLAPPDLESYRYLTIVPDGRLHLVPFDALIRPDRSYWGKNQIISYTPSAATEFVLRSRQRQPRSDDRTFLGVGSVNYGVTRQTDALSPPAPRSGGDSSVDDDEEAFDPAHMRRLPDSLEEVRSAAAQVDPDATLKTGDNATKTAFYDVKPESFKIIHFAVHAVTDVKRPDRAALILQSDPPRSDGRLEARDILRIRLRSELVVLSACETAVGRLQGEEGIANLTRAWLAAGADSVVSTLWPVDDSFTLYLMKRFYEHLAAGDDKASALHSAKLDLLKQFGEDTPPVFWAGFTLTGAGTSKVGIKNKVELAENK